MAEITIYPSVDARMQQSGSNVTWATLVGGAGDYAGPNDTQGGVGWSCGTSADRFSSIERTGYIFDILTALGAGAVVTGAVFSLYGQSKTDVNSNTPNFNVYDFTPASTSNIVAGDFDGVGSTPYCDTPVTYAGWSTAGYNAYTLNATAIAAINAALAAGYFSIGGRNANKDVANSAPTWGSATDNYVVAYLDNQAGTANDPKLVITYTPAPSGFLAFM